MASGGGALTTGANCPADVANAANLPGRLLVENLRIGGWITLRPAASRDEVHVVGEGPAHGWAPHALSGLRRPGPRPLLWLPPVMQVAFDAS